MFKFKKKTFIIYAVCISLLLSLSFLTLTLRRPFLSILKQPLNLMTLAKQELGALVFFHRNFIQARESNKQIEKLKQRLNTLNEVYMENMRLQKLLALKQNSSFKVIAARVIGRSPDNWSRAVVIDKGATNGIKRGMAVITYLGVVGRVIETTNSTAKVLLISDPDLGISAIVQRSRQEGLVSGTLGNNLVMRYLPQGCDIKAGDVIVTSGLSQVFPKGVLIGIVSDVQNDFSGLSRYAVIKPAVNLSDIEEVLVIVL